MYIVNKIIMYIMGIACLAIIGCVGFDLVKHALKISQKYKVVGGDSEIYKRALSILQFVS